ncbi:MAG: DNA primase [Clostridia bacterium]|nr:DNA primase [Clostridia bacterium]
MVDNEIWSKFIEELKAKTDFVGVISRYVQLERKGRLFWGRCPFHAEKTPSFAVNDYDQFYHCFGCGVGGDIIKFVKEIESVDYMGAIHILAEQARMEVPSRYTSASEEQNIKKRKEQRDRLISLMKDAAMHYVENLNSPKAKVGNAYLQKRAIDGAVGRAFGLGFSLDYNDMPKFLESKGYTQEEMIASGVVKLKDGRLYDVLGGRVVFPIIDVNSNVVAFGGRTLESNPDFAKYLNTAETLLFNKSKNLYAINLIKKMKTKSIKFDSLIIVEGYMDVISLHKAGFNTAVASMGTALTTEQAKLLKRFVDKVYICYDGDGAGKKATLRGLDILKDNGLDVYVMSLPEGLDPDDVINKYGQSGYKKLMDQALPLIDFKLEFLKKLYDVKTSEGKTKYLNEAIEVLNSLSNVEREVYISKVSEISGIMKDFIKRQLVSDGSEKKPTQNKMLTTGAVKVTQTEIREKIPQDKKIVQAEKFILSAMLHKKPYAHFKRDLTEFFTDGRDEFYKVIMELSNTVSEKDLPKAFFEKFAGPQSDDGEETIQDKTKNVKAEKAIEIINYILKNVSDENDLSYFKDCVQLIYKGYAERRIQILNEQYNKEIEKEKRAAILKEIGELAANKNKKVDL